MTSDLHPPELLGTLRAAAGKGVVRMEGRFNTDIRDVWSAITDPVRLGSWMGEVTGDLRVGGEYKYRFYASGAQGTGRVETCEAPHRFVLAHGLGDRFEKTIEATFTQDGDHAVLVIEESGMPIDLLAAFGAGIQIHMEDLGAHLAGQERCDADARWDELEPAYSVLAAQVL